MARVSKTRNPKKFWFQSTQHYGADAASHPSKTTTLTCERCWKNKLAEYAQGLPEYSWMAKSVA